MAIAAAATWEVRTAGNDTNGGAFVTGAAGTDYSQSDTARTGTGTNDSTTDAVTNGTTTLTSATANFQASIVGNVIYLSGGTGALAATRRQITARTNTTTVTMDATVAASTGVTMNIGGALLSPGIVSAFMTASNRVFVKAGTYNITSTSAGVAGGIVSTGVICQWEGYETNRGDRSFVRPVLTASGISTATLFTLGTNDSSAICIDTDGAGLTAIRGFSSTVRANFLRCKSSNTTNSGFNITSASSFLGWCWAFNNDTAGAGFVGLAGAMLQDCYASDGSTPGFSGNGTFCRCIADSNSGASSDGFVTANQGTRYINCVSYGNGRDGYRTSTTDCQWYYCLSEGNAGWGYNVSAGSGAGCYLYLCSNYNDTLGRRTGTYLLGVWDFYPGDDTFFVDAAGGDFSLLNTGEGENVQAIPDIFADEFNINYLDLGAMQHYPRYSTFRPVGKSGLITRA